MSPLPQYVEVQRSMNVLRLLHTRKLQSLCTWRKRRRNMRWRTVKVGRRKAYTIARKTKGIFLFCRSPGYIRYTRFCLGEDVIIHEFVIYCTLFLLSTADHFLAMFSTYHASPMFFFRFCTRTREKKIEFCSFSLWISLFQRHIYVCQ